MKTIAVYDTPPCGTGPQSEEINLTSEDKLLVARKLDELGMHYIEGGWPGSNPTDREFFAAVSAQGFKNAKLAAFGSTHAPRGVAHEDKNLQALVDCGASVATIFGKTWDFHVKAALRIPLEQNLDLIGNSLAFLKPNMEEVFFDAEHFFDGFAASPDYALACLKRAHEAGARRAGALRHQRRAPCPRTWPRPWHGSARSCPRPGSASTATTTRKWPWPIPWKPCARARCRSRAPSTATANAAATPTSAPSSPTWSSRWAARCWGRTSCPCSPRPATTWPRWPTCAPSCASPSWAGRPSPTRAAST